MNGTSRRIALTAAAVAAVAVALPVSLAVWPEAPPPPAGGAVEVLGAVNGREMVTHGNDSPPPPSAAPRAGREVAWPCVGDGTDGPRVQMLYVHAEGAGNLDGQRANFESYARSVQGVFFDSSGGQRLVRYVTEADCSLSIVDVTVSAGALKDFGRLVDELAGQGFDRTDRKYHAWMDGFDYCGIGTVQGDDRAGGGNANNAGPSYSLTGGLCRRYAEAHEIAHNLGAVQLSAPNSTGGWHCTDESDVMCYADGGPTDDMRQVCPASGEDRFDCGGNDYFAVVPAGGSYLAGHWNMADSAYLSSGSPPTTQPPPPPPTTAPPPTTTTTVGRAATFTALAVPSSVRVGVDVAVAATVTGSCGPDGGVVRFYVSGRRIAQAVVEDGTASAVLRFARPGRVTVRADYRGNDTCATSRTSAKVTVRA